MPDINLPSKFYFPFASILIDIVIFQFEMDDKLPSANDISQKQFSTIDSTGMSKRKAEVGLMACFYPTEDHQNKSSH